MRSRTTMNLQSGSAPMQPPTVHVREGHPATRIQTVFNPHSAEPIYWYAECPSEIAQDLAVAIRALARCGSDEAAVREMVRQLARDVLGEAGPQQIGEAILSDPLVGDAMRQATAGDPR